MLEKAENNLRTSTEVKNSALEAKEDPVSQIITCPQATSSTSPGLCNIFMLFGEVLTVFAPYLTISILGKF